MASVIPCKFGVECKAQLVAAADAYNIFPLRAIRHPANRGDRERLPATVDF